MGVSWLIRAVALGVFAVALSGACNGDDNGDGGIEVVVDPTRTNTPTQVQVGSVTRDPTDEPTPSPTTSSTTPGGPTGELLACNDILAPVNKQNSLPEDCVPYRLVALPVEYSWGGTQQLIQEAATAFIEMMEAAKRDGFSMVTRSSYRSYADQADTFQYWVNYFGGNVEEANRSSARAGHSEHQLGTTADLTSASAGYELEGFEGTAEAAWVADHAHEFGFVISYPPGTEQITGYIHEPWHVRYVGKDVAADVKASGKTLHEYLLGR